ncbi:MAG: hypothetical protein WAM67_17960, partial [Candidatus Acidiferrales bacterium]
RGILSLRILRNLSGGGRNLGRTIPVLAVSVFISVEGILLRARVCQAKPIASHMFPFLAVFLFL